jgi:hypothetical protein
MKTAAYDAACKNKGCGTKMLVLSIRRRGRSDRREAGQIRADQGGVRFVREDAPDIITCPECDSVYGTIEAAVFPTIDPS